MGNGCFTRVLTKRERRQARELAQHTRHRLRRELVHAAGCVYRGDAHCYPCATIGVIPELIIEALELGVSIPRSLRHLAHGRSAH